ncbi:cupredoxin domain-containing protein [Candidatus Berkelbacteria bacterium]|nr:cupredoxin domain-containing protein [Candidatus Berkelbacteria bacterium]
MYRVIVLAFGLSLIPATSLAQSTETTTTDAAESTTLAPETPLDETAFDLPAPTGWEFFKRRFVHFFTFGEVKRLRQELALANLTLVAAEEAETAGDDDRAAELLDQFTTEIERISGRVSDAAGDLATRTDDAQVESLLEQIQADRILQAGVAEQLSATTQAELQAKALKVRTSALRDLAKLLAADSPTPEKFQKRVAKIAEKLAEREAKLERKIAKRLAALEAIDEEIDEPEFEDAIEQEEADELKDVAALDDASLGEVVREIQGSLAKHLLVLQALLDQLPDASKDTVEAVLERGVEQLKDRIEQDRELLKRLFDEDHESELQDKLLERLNKETEQSAEAVKKVVETQRESTKKALEREREREKKAAEVQAESQKTETSETDDDQESNDDTDKDDAETDADVDDDAAPSASTGTTPSQSSSSTGSSGSGSSDDAEDEVKTETKEIEIDDSRFKTTRFEVKKATQLTVKLKNKDSMVHDFSIVGASTTTGSVSPGGEKSVTFTVDKDLEFSCSLHSSVPHGTITAKN